MSDEKITPRQAMRRLRSARRRGPHPFVPNTYTWTGRPHTHARQSARRLRQQAAAALRTTSAV